MRTSAALLLSLWCLRAMGSEWFVSPNGNDMWSGRLPAANAEQTDGPFASLSHARDAVRAERGERNVTLRGGVYAVPKGMVLGADDSGTAEAPVVWKAFEKEKPLIVAGRAITEWKPWKDGIYQADVGAQGFKDIAFKQLLYNGERQILARYPNYDPRDPVGGGWAYVEGEMSPMYEEKEGESKCTLQVAAVNWRNWSRPEDVEVFVFPRYNWWNDIVRVKAVDPATRVITTVKDASYAMRPNDRYYFQGALEELDAPGEWYLDKQTWTLYFKPPGPMDGAAIYAPTTRSIIELQEGAQYITLRGLTFECCEGTAISMTKASHNRVIGCTVRNVGDMAGMGIAVQDGEDDGIVGCDIHHTGRDGVSLNGGDVQTLKSAGHFVDNCYIHDSGVFYKQGAGVSLGGVGQRVTHTLIHDTPRFGIVFTGNNHLLEYNHLRHLALETEDVGATYCGGRDWISPRGSIIRYNYIHDILGYGWNGKWSSPYFAWGIYLDDNSGGVDVMGNIVVRCSRSLIHGHSARDCRVYNNIFVEGGLRQWEFNGWTTAERSWMANLPAMQKGYESVVAQTAWKAMRGMEIPPQKIADTEGRVMSGNIFARNIIAWKRDESKALNVVAYNPERNQFDGNLYWHDGKPLRTGIVRAGKPIGSNLTPNLGFNTGKVGDPPKDWQLQIRPFPDTKAVLIEEKGQRMLRMDASFDASKTENNYPIMVSHDIELKPGASYRLHARLRTDQEEATAALLVQFFLPAKNGAAAYFWGSSPSAAKVGREWRDFDFSVKIPAKGEHGWREQMKMFRVRLDWPAKDGALFADDISLQQVEPLDEWRSWQESGGDRHSLIADPRFIAPEKDDYRLLANSPAWALGFKPIPVEKIGPYESAERATWPIVEAAGARERMAK